MLRSIDAAYHDLLKPVLKKHEATLAKMDALMESGEVGRAQQLWRRSGLLDDLAKALANAGAVSAEAIRGGLGLIREAVRNDAGGA